MTVAQLFTEFGELIGIPELALDSDGECCLRFDEVLLDFQHETDRDESLLSSAQTLADLFQRRKP